MAGSGADLSFASDRNVKTPLHSDAAALPDDSELEAALFGKSAEATLDAHDQAEQALAPTDKEVDGAGISIGIEDPGIEAFLFGDTMQRDLKMKVEQTQQSVEPGEAELFSKGNGVGGEDDLMAAIFRGSSLEAASARNGKVEKNEEQSGPSMAAGLVGDRVAELSRAAPLVEEDTVEEEDLYGALYGDVDLKASSSEEILREAEGAQPKVLSSLSTLQVSSALPGWSTPEEGFNELKPGKGFKPGGDNFGTLPVEEDAEKLAAVVGLTNPVLGGGQEEEDDSEESDSEDEFEILVNDDHFRPPVGHSAMPPISRTPARAPNEGDEDEDSDSDSDDFTIILDEEGAVPAAGFKPGLEDDQGLQREYSLKVRRREGLASACTQAALCAACSQCL
jgi:hypothetical protein